MVGPQTFKMPKQTEKTGQQRMDQQRDKDNHM